MIIPSVSGSGGRLQVALVGNRVSPRPGLPTIPETANWNLDRLRRLWGIKWGGGFLLSTV